MNDALLQKTQEFYGRVKSVYKKTGYDTVYELNTFWANENMKVMLNIIHNSSSAAEAIKAIQKTWLFSVNTPDSVKEKAVDWLLAEQRKRGVDIFHMDSSVQESPFSNPDNNVSRMGRIFTPDFLCTVNIATEIKKYCQIPESRFRVIELGAGCGHLARTLRLLNPNCSHIIIDIPETLCFSYMFLNLNFPNLKTLFVTDEEQLRDISTEEYDYVFVPTKFAEGVLKNSFDIFVNTASLGEMTNSVIRYWMDFIQNKLKVKYIFTLNRYLNTILTNGCLDWRLQENECSVSYDSNWKILNWELEPPYTRCPYVDTIIARYVEIIAERTPNIPIKEKEEKSRRLLLEVMDEDWVRLEKLISPIVTCRDNILVHDLTMSGTLFKLWESIRLDPNESNVALMLKYLETLIHMHDVEFEETFYYENLFENLFKSKDKKDLLEIAEVIKAKRRYRKLQSQMPPSYTSSRTLNPLLVEEGYKGFNIVAYMGKFYAVAQSLGRIDFSDINIEDLLQGYRDKSQCFVGRSIFEAKHLLDKHRIEALQGEIAEIEDKEANIVK